MTGESRGISQVFGPGILNDSSSSWKGAAGVGLVLWAGAGGSLMEPVLVWRVQEFEGSPFDGGGRNGGVLRGFGAVVAYEDLMQLSIPRRGL